MSREIEQYIRFEYKPVIEISSTEYSSRTLAHGSESYLEADVAALGIRAEQMRISVSKLLAEDALKRGPMRTINIGDMILLPNCVQLISIRETHDGFLDIRYIQVIE